MRKIESSQQQGETFMLSAITRGVSQSLGNCELSYLSRQRIDVARAAGQQRLYEQKLVQLGVRVHSLPAHEDLPDCVFVEDPAVVFEECAVLTMGIESRRRERESLARFLSDFRALKSLSEPARLEGGDVLRVGRTLYVGDSGRTNEAGRAQLQKILLPFDYEVRAVSVHGCLHLKTGCSYLGRGLMLVNSAWVDAAPFADFELLEVPQAEPWAANVLVIGETVLLPEGFPQTRALIEQRGFQVETIDVSELMKAEAGLTCMSIIFNERNGRD
jgi:dimethylargininase